MGDILPLTPSLRPYVDQLNQGGPQRREHHSRLWNFSHHTLPLALGLGAAVTGGVLIAQNRDSDASAGQDGCGIATVSPNQGPLSIFDEAIDQAGVGAVDNYDSSAAEVAKLLPTPQVNQRVGVVIVHNTIVRVIEVGPDVNPCTPSMTATVPTVQSS